MDWYAEFELVQDARERSPSKKILLTAHLAYPDNVQPAVEGFERRSVSVRGGPALAVTSHDGPNIVVFELEPGYTLRALSYVLTIDDLRDWMDRLEAVTAKEWVTRGGRVQS